jgi:hypothetical protein
MEFFEKFEKAEGVNVMGSKFQGGAQEGLLFYLSGENGSTADFANGQATPTFFSDVDIIDSGVNGKAFQCADTQLMAYKAPGNIYAQRGTVSFFGDPDIR